jgi:ribosomal protein S16
MKVIGLTETLRREVRHHRTALQSALDALLQSNGGLAKLGSRRQTLTDEIAALEESADSSDAAALQALGQRRTELTLVEQRIEKLAEAGTPQAETLHELLSTTGALVKRALTPTYEHYEADIAARFRPFYRACGWEKRAARETDAVKEFGEFLHPRFIANPVGAQRALAILAQIEDGALDWNFNPNAR